jgi:crotonobetainyl-CoA:carnitine CoA-transferase CaiB-like acyl-CoA transferase
VGIAYPDFIAPHVLASLVLAAVRMRDPDGRGREITIDQLGATMSLMGAAWARYQHEGPAGRTRPCSFDPTRAATSRCSFACTSS